VLTSSTSAGTATISGKLNGSAMSNGTSVAFVPGSATKLVFTSGTASVVSGATKTLTAAVEDANNNIVTTDNSTVVTFAQTAGAGSVTGLGDATASSGVAAVTVTGLNSGSLTVTASKSGLTSDTSTFSITVGAATKLVVTSNTASVASGSTKTLTANVEDANDNIVTSDNSTVVVFSQTAGAGSVTGLG